MKKAQLVRENGVVKLAFHDRIIEPLSFKSFRPTKRNISDFYNAGVRIFDILTSGVTSLLGVPYSLYGESWVGDSQFDFTPVDKQIELFLENAPEAYFALMVQLDTRDWYCRTHGTDESFYHLSRVVSAPAWLAAATEYLRRMIRHVEEKYPDRFYGYFLLCGMTTEWFSPSPEDEPSRSEEEAYRRAFGDNAEIPSLVRQKMPDNILFLNPETDKDLMDYRRFRSEEISKAICHFAHVVKEETEGNRLCGVYFGYLFELTKERLWNAGSLDYERVFESPDIDMISSPSSYAFRAYDDVSAVMVTSDTLDARNKLYFLEFDQRTHLSPAFVPGGNGIRIPGAENGLKTEKQSVDVMRRDFMLCTARRIALWWFDMFEGWFYSEGMMNEVRRFVEIAHHLARRPNRSVAEVCVIGDGQSLYAVNSHSRFNDSVLSDQRGPLGEMGAPYDCYSVCDLERLDLRRYRLVIFLDKFCMTDAERDFIRKKICSANRTVLFFTAPDAVQPDGVSEAAVSEMTGIRVRMKENVKLAARDSSGSEYGLGLTQTAFVPEDDNAEVLARFENGSVALARKKQENWTSVFASIGALPATALREILYRAGVHQYTSDCPVYVSSAVIGLYLPEGKGTTVSVPRDGIYTDLFTGKRYRAEAGKVTVTSGNSRAVLLEIPE